MLPEKIIFQSAGSLSVALLALLMMILQVFFFFRKFQFAWCAWSAAISFSALLYSVAIFLEYNTVQGTLDRVSGLLEWTAIVFLIHSLYGFTFSYFGIAVKRYHLLAGLWHGLILLLLWFSPFVVAESFAARPFIGLASPFVEPALGPLGFLFILYTALAALNAMRIWVRHKKTNPKHRYAYLIGMGFWLLLGIHDGLAALGMPALQYFMEYGFIGFAIVVLWVVSESCLETAAEEKYRVITEFANDCILIIQDEKIVFGNPACRRMIGRPLTHSASTGLLDIMGFEDHKSVLEHSHTLLAGGCPPNPQTVRILRMDGEYRFVEYASSVIQFRNRPAVLSVMRDITKRKREEEALRKSEEKLVRYKKMESLGLLAGGVAHDLNNVLAGVVSYPELILMNLPENSNLRKPLETIHESGKRAAAIVQDLLTVARGVAIAKEPLNLNTLIVEFFDSPEFKKLEQFHPAVTIKTCLDADLFNVSGSHVHIRKVLMNLVSNASEAINERGNVIISTTNRYIDRPLRGYDNVNIGEYAVLTVSDTGSGITANDLERIFEPFYTKKVMGRSGTGLGLAVVWNVVQDHEGYIDVETGGNGTSFEVYFPITRDEVTIKESAMLLEGYKGNGETILVVDDVESQRDISCKMLDRLGYKTTAVSSGEEAIDYLKENTVDLILLDMIMDPGINGRETYQRVIEIHPDQKAVIVSGFAETDEVREIQKFGSGRYIKKPFTFETIGIVVKEELLK